MLARIRDFAKSKAAMVLLGLLILSFAIFGIGDVFQNRSGDWVVRAGNRTVSQAEFRRIFDNVKEQAEQQAQRPVTIQEAVDAKLHLRVLEDLAGAEAFAEILRRIGLTPSDKLVVEEIRKAPVFFDAVSGRFDEQLYQRQLAENGLTPDRFEAFLRDELAQSHFVQGVVAGLRAPRVYGAAAAAFEGEVRDLSLMLVHPGLVGAPPEPTDAQLNAFLKENAERLRRPEMRALTIVRFNANDLAAQVAIDPAEVQRRYDFRKDSLSTPERRTLVQVPARDAASAARAAAQLRTGADPAAVARSLGVEAVRYNAAARTAIPDRRVAEAAFTLPAGQVSNPIQGELGFSVVQVVSVTPGRQVGIEEIRPQIEGELRREAAAERAYELVQKYEEARETGATLAEAARAAGVPTVSLPPVTQDGRDARGQQLQLEPKLLTAAFDQPAGGESDVEEIAPGQYAAIRVERVMPPALPPIAEIRPQLVQIWRVRELGRRIEARAQALATEARGGQPLEAVAGRANAPFTRVADLRRGGQGAPVPPEVVGRAFGAKAGEIIIVPTAQAGSVVVRVDAIRSAPPAVMAAGVEQRRPAVTLDVIEEIGQLARAAARRALKVRTNADQALAALGLAPEDTAAAGEDAGDAPAAR